MKKIVLFILCGSIAFNSGCASYSAADKAFMASVILLKYLKAKGEAKDRKKQNKKEEREPEKTIYAKKNGEVKIVTVTKLSYQNINELIENAKWNYSHFNYTQTTTLLESLPKDKAVPGQLLSAYSYLGAAYYLENQMESAETAFKNILLVDREYQLDSGVFPSHIIIFFNKIKTESIQ